MSDIINFRPNDHDPWFIGDSKVRTRDGHCAGTTGKMVQVLPTQLSPKLSPELSVKDWLSSDLFGPYIESSTITFGA